jgi:hypothetical protein
MAHLSDVQTPGWPDIFRVETTTPWVGGTEGTANMQARQLKERTEYLKERAGEVDQAKQGMPSLEARIEAIGSSPKALYKKDFVPDVPVAASTEHVDIGSGGLLEIDGVQTAAGDLVFLKDQSDPVENGFWEVQTGAWNRYDGYTGGETECFTQKLIDVNGGQENKGLLFVLEADAYVIGQTALHFRQIYLSSVKKPGTALFRNRTGRVEELETLGAALLADQVEGYGRDLMAVLLGHPFSDMTSQSLRNEAIAEVMAKLRIRLNNNGELDDSAIPDCRGLFVGDYLDGLDLSGIAAAPGGTAPQPWNDTYKNNRLTLSGFNLYKGAGTPENTKNHFNFTFRNCICTGHMNPTGTNAGGYPATEMRTFLEGALKTGLQNALGDYLLPVRLMMSVKNNWWDWGDYTVFLLSEFEIWGLPIWSEAGYGAGFRVQYPIYQKNGAYKLKRYNGVRAGCWESSPTSSTTSEFCDIHGPGAAWYDTAIHAMGISPAFCVV